MCDVAPGNPAGRGVLRSGGPLPLALVLELAGIAFATAAAIVRACKR